MFGRRKKARNNSAGSRKQTSNHYEMSGNFEIRTNRIQNPDIPRAGRRRAEHGEPVGREAKLGEAGQGEV